MRLILLFILLLTGLCAAAQLPAGYVGENETLIYGFRTKNGKYMSLSKANDDAYIVYRYGSKSRIELEFPGKDKESWKKLTYSYLLRGGGFENSGLDLNYLVFVKDDEKYIIFENYHSENESYETGLRTIDLKTGKMSTMPADADSRKGSLADLRDNLLIGRSEELYD